MTEKPTDMLMVLEPAEAEPLTFRQRLGGFLFAGCGFLVMYCLAAGPMAALHRNFPFRPFRTAVEIVFAPIVFVVKNDIPPLAGILKWYVQLFQ